MRYDNMLWVLIAPALASFACFAVEMSSNLAESWNNRFEELRCGFANAWRQGEASKRSRILITRTAVNCAERVALVAERKRRR